MAYQNHGLGVKAQINQEKNALSYLYNVGVLFLIWNFNLNIIIITEFTDRGTFSAD